MFTSLSVTRFVVLIGLVGAPLLVGGCRSNKVTFALPVADWWTAAPFVQSQAAGIFKKHGLEVATLEVNSGLASKNAVAAGTADIGLAAATPLALAAARKEGLVVFGAYLRSGAVIGLVRPRETQAGTLPEAPVAIVPSTISESFLYHFLARIGQQQLVEKKQLMQLSARPADVPALLRNRSAKSAVIWEPFLSFASQLPGFAVDRTDVGFEVNVYLVTRPGILRDRPEMIRNFLAAVDESCKYLTNNGERARQELEQHFGFQRDFIAPAWPSVHYGVSRDRSRLEAEIKREATTATSLGYIAAVPDFQYLLEGLSSQ